MLLKDEKISIHFYGEIHLNKIQSLKKYKSYKKTTVIAFSEWSEPLNVKIAKTKMLTNVKKNKIKPNKDRYWSSPWVTKKQKVAKGYIANSIRMLTTAKNQMLADAKRSKTIA